MFSIGLDGEERMEYEGGYGFDHWDDACSVVSIVA